MHRRNGVVDRGDRMGGGGKSVDGVETNEKWVALILILDVAVLERKLMTL